MVASFLSYHDFWSYHEYWYIYHTCNNKFIPGVEIPDNSSISPCSCLGDSSRCKAPNWKDISNCKLDNNSSSLQKAINI